MNPVNILDAKTSLSRLVAAVESGEEKEIIIARNGKPVARLAPLEKRPKVRLGLYQGRYKAPKDFDALNADVARLFGIDS
ncbi:type II toxin-antitoxin system Phd/YefM family antitoxin [Polycyclovorans algicola]|uniref:type II toxin-antitoxin system Phd/YefM family antitoxin n=1 Tax=Polycyclovorans algicola TaxID=616992 RepID=UPI0004A762B3|nr:type II toxin-antitoxin system prevent-host-death family antitoxin [Polycyclovorans algicola]